MVLWYYKGVITIDKWLTVADACQALGLSDRTMRRRIKSGDIRSKLDNNGHRLIWISEEAALVHGRPNGGQNIELDKFRTDNQSLTTENDLLKARISELEKDRDNLQQQIENLQTHLQDASQRHDTVVMQMTRMLEYERQPFWRRWVKHKALPAPESIIDMEQNTEEENF